jgi:hypothetical protein
MGRGATYRRLGMLNVGNEMKMQMRKILVFPAVDDQTISRELKFVYQALNGGK